MLWLKRWFINKMHFQKTRLSFGIFETQTRNLLVAYLYQQSFLGQVTSLFCTTILLIGLYHSSNGFAVLMGWFIYSICVVIARIGMTYLYQSQINSEYSVRVWKNLFVLGALLGGLSWGFAGSYLFWFSNDIQQTLIILVIAGITSGAVPILAAELSAAILFLAAALLPLIIQLFFQPKAYIYALFSITVLAYFVYMLILAVRSHRLLKQTIGLQFEKEALIKDLHDANEKFSLASEKLHSVETHDLLTGLSNRKFFTVTLMEAIKRAESSQKNLAVLYMDLDNFKFINDAYGYEMGDQLLIMAVQRIREHLRKPDFLARMGGDEFAIILENQTQISDISKIANEMCRLLAKPFNVDDYHINMSVSIGVSVYPMDGVLADVLVKKADKAMQYIKEHGHNNFHFNTKMSESSR